MSHNVVDIKKLNKVYGQTKSSPENRALRDVDLLIPKGSIFALLGPNGAGKSTIINIMAGLVVKSSGTVKIWDYDIDVNERQAKSAIGVVPQEINFDPFFTPSALLDIQAGLYGVPKNERRTKELLDVVGLSDQAHAYTRSLSGGMRRRLMVAKAMVHNPPILVLDEPTAGVDIELRRHLWGYVKELSRQGTTVLLTTHYLEEAEALCDRIAIIHQGQIVANDEKEVLLSQIDQKEIAFRLDKELAEIPTELSVYHAKNQGNRSILCRYSPGKDSVGHMIEILRASGYGIVDISTDESDLEHIFLQLTR